MVAAAALLAEAPEQRGDVLPQDAAAVLYEEANQLAHLQGREAAAGLEREPFDSSFLSLQLPTIHLDCYTAGWRCNSVYAELHLLK